MSSYLDVLQFIFNNIRPIRADRICVLPGPAITSTGPSVCSAASRCAKLSPFIAFLKAALCWWRVGMGQIYTLFEI